jgi:ABC-type multidrug transport system ATPase subunit
LKECSGKFQPNTVTAILGPSGSGKTTMLNLLSGRLLSKNLTLKGSIKINGKIVTTMGEYQGAIGYVMQEDLMLATFTPR